ncbi:MAG: EcoRII N-terminal effector-binding domain-containing protein [Syntrophorhabdaceae bacterium]|nr:EcoRII N-terminal effector-binding domain-containing protein [Syntrophorhabdaceae bacterium]
MKTQVVEKVLSANDTGETGGHQSGILVPKDPIILGFFPSLNTSVKNPRAVLKVLDQAGRQWSFNFIYYNNRFFGGTRNEFRLTGMTDFFREFNLKAGDVVILRQLYPGHVVNIDYRRASSNKRVLRLTGTWKVIEGDF